jgi:hypothetical protein
MALAECNRKGLEVFLLWVAPVFGVAGGVHLKENLFAVSFLVNKCLAVGNNDTCP